MNFKHVEYVNRILNNFLFFNSYKSDPFFGNFEDDFEC